MPNKIFPVSLESWCFLHLTATLKMTFQGLIKAEHSFYHKFRLE